MDKVIMCLVAFGLGFSFVIACGIAERILDNFLPKPKGSTVDMRYYKRKVIQGKGGNGINESTRHS